MLSGYAGGSRVISVELSLLVGSAVALGSVFCVLISWLDGADWGLDAVEVQPTNKAAAVSPVMEAKNIRCDSFCAVFGVFIRLLKQMVSQAHMDTTALWRR